ncbi:MAG: hypothetical protein UX04_C0004G0047 [Microgenomates group bacterium GW2011_GWF2_45_18]|nr:MAG: hypothetical protein UW18_C0004G0047 [Microgenomates group bacterium GW2011_GWF1_44_10]KKU01703.1 MAG: hypothetical protein UX04_C0004G0047 [Microgenomates group bacterium GW2011_GWF2_45_18]OGJ41373.1 MAG: hypothetical protein A2378_03310 [Candidatus Pacebacteria bacterium RIFOXYB1_FULL_44_10]HAU99558.1 hypothetical protein [Candidatus Paceibacterota bacterium]HAX01482.1 hypothetical protein [Candidatus Paceibacterota bacterium]
MQVTFHPTFSISQLLLLYIGRIEACKEVIQNAPVVPSHEFQFRKLAHVRSAFHGTHLEGNGLTKDQVEKLIDAGGRTGSLENPIALAQRAGITARERDIQELLNFRTVLEWIDMHGSTSSSFSNLIRTRGPNQDAQEKPTYTQDMLKHMHALVTARIIPEDQIGRYRTQQVVVRSAESGEIVYRPPLAMDVPAHLDAFFSWLNSDEGRSIHPILRAGITHYQLVAIHPFIEGNGRSARALATYVLYAEGYDVKRFFSLEEYFDHDVNAYYNAILSVQKHPQKDLTYWLEFFAFGLAVELDKIKSQVVKLSQDARLKTKLGGTQVALTERQIILLEYLHEHEEFSVQQANYLIPLVSPDTILRDIKDLMDKGIIEKMGVTKGVRYVLRK